MKRKFLIVLFISLAIEAALIGVMSIEFLNTIYYNSAIERLTSNVNLIQESIVWLDESGSDINNYKLVQQLSDRIKERVTLFDKDGKPVADSVNNSLIFENRRTSREMLSAIRGTINYDIRKSKDTGIWMMYIVSTPFKYKDDIVMVGIESSLSEVRYYRDTFLGLLAIAVLIGLIVAGVQGTYQMNKLIKPIEKLTKAAKAVSLGKFEEIPLPQAKGEIRVLSEGFNEMAHSLNQMMSEVKTNKFQLESILNSMINGILAIGPNNEIIFCNEQASIILNYKLEKKQFFNHENLSSQEYHDFFEKTLENPYYTEELRVKIKANMLTIKLASYPIVGLQQDSTAYSRLIMIQDITKLVKLESMRRDFVANVSHEIRTPLTTLSGFVETLESLESLNRDQQMKIYGIMNHEIMRLKALLNDILSLSKIETMERVHTMKDVDLNKVIEEIFILFKPVSRSKYIELNLLSKNKSINLNCSEDLIRQIFVNLIDNAIKYTKDGGVISVQIEESETKVTIEVKDTGIGIPEQDIKHITERFYRVDKDRNRTTGGTGLGLSIVKHIIQQMNGTLDIQSKLGLGTSIAMTFPKKLK